MAINWLTALKILPWSDMIEYAPKLVSGAHKAWQRVKVGKDAVDANVRWRRSAEPQTEFRSNLQREVQALQTQQLEMTHLIKAHAEQNQRLVEAVGVLRSRTRLLCLVNAGWLVALVVWYFALLTPCVDHKNLKLPHTAAGSPGGLGLTLAGQQR